MKKPKQDTILWVLGILAEACAIIAFVLPMFTRKRPKPKK